MVILYDMPCSLSVIRAKLRRATLAPVVKGCPTEAVVGEAQGGMDGRGHQGSETMFSVGPSMCIVIYSCLAAGVWTCWS